MDPITWIAIFVVTMLVSAGVTYALTPKPKFSNAKPASVNDLEIPQPPTDEPIPIIYGTVQTQLYILHHGGFTFTEVPKRDATIGYRYYLDCVFGISDQCGELVEVRVSNKHLREYEDMVLEWHTTGEKMGAQHYHIDPLNLNVYPRQGYWREIYSNLGFWRALDAIYDAGVDGYDKYPYELYFSSPYWSGSRLVTPGNAQLVTPGNAQYHGFGGYAAVGIINANWNGDKVFVLNPTRDSFTKSTVPWNDGQPAGIARIYSLHSDKMRDRYRSLNTIDSGTITRNVYTNTFTNVTVGVSGTAVSPVYYFALPVSFSIDDEGVSGKIKFVTQSNRVCYAKGMRVIIEGGVKYLYMHLYDDPGYMTRSTGISTGAGQSIEVYWIKCSRESMQGSKFEDVTATKYVFGVNTPLVPNGKDAKFGGYITSFTYYKYTAVPGAVPTVTPLTGKLWMGGYGSVPFYNDVYFVLVGAYLCTADGIEELSALYCYNEVPSVEVGSDGDYAIDPFRKTCFIKRGGIWCHDETNELDPHYDVAGMIMPDIRLFVGPTITDPVPGTIYVRVIPHTVSDGSWVEVSECRLTGIPSHAYGIGNRSRYVQDKTFLTSPFGRLTNQDSMTVYDGGDSGYKSNYATNNQIGAKFLFKPSISSVLYSTDLDSVHDLVDPYMYESTGIPSTYNDISVVFGRKIFLGLGPTLPNFTFVVCNIPNIAVLNAELKAAFEAADIKPAYLADTDITFAEFPYLCSCIVAPPPKSYFFDKGNTSLTSSAAITVREHKLQKDINPALILLDLLIRHAKTPIEMIDIPSFASAAVKLYQEYTGMSLIILTQTSISDIITLVLEHIDGFLFSDPTTGKLKLTLARARTSEETNQTALTCADIGDVTITRENIANCATKLNVKYFDGYPSVAFEDPSKVVSMGSFQTKIDSIVFNPMDSKFTIENEVTLDRTGFSNRSTLYRNLKRSIKKYTYPYATIKFTMDLALFTKQLGDVVRINLPSYEVYDQYYRITEIDFRDDKSTIVQVTAIEDIYDTSDTNFLVDDSSIVTTYVDTSTLAYTTYTVPVRPELRPDLTTYNPASFYVYAMCLVSWLPIHKNGVVKTSENVIGGNNQIACVPSGIVSLTGTGAYVNTWTYFDSLRITSMPTAKYGVQSDSMNELDPLYQMVGDLPSTEKLAVLVYETTSGDQFYEYVTFEDITEVSSGVYDVTGVLRGAYNSPVYVNDASTDGTIMNVSMFFISNVETVPRAGSRAFVSDGYIVRREYTSYPLSFDQVVVQVDAISDVACTVVDSDAVLEWARPGKISEMTLRFSADTINGYVNGVLKTIYRYKARFRIPCISKGYVQPLTDEVDLQGVTEDFRRRSEKDSISIGITDYLSGTLGQYSYTRRIGSYISGTAYEFVDLELVLAYDTEQNIDEVFESAYVSMSHNTMGTTLYGTQLSDSISFDLNLIDTAYDHYIFLKNGRLYCRRAYLDDQRNLTAFADFEGKEITRT